jgi:hypothetical protein
MPDTARLSALVLSLAIPPGIAAAAPAWKLVREVPVAQGTVVVAYLDDRNGFTTGCSAPMHRSVDGGETWGEEQLSTPFHGAAVTLSADGKILSAVVVGGASVKVYRAD